MPLTLSAPCIVPGHDWDEVELVVPLVYGQHVTDLVRAENRILLTEILTEQ